MIEKNERPTTLCGKSQRSVASDGAAKQWRRKTPELRAG